MSSQKELEQLKSQIDKLKGQSLEYLRKNTRGQKQRQERTARLEELYNQIKSLLEGSAQASDFESEVRKFAEGMRVTPGVKARGAGLTRIEGIGMSTVQRLLESGVTTTQKLLDSGASPRGRKQLAKEVGTSDRQILTWVNSADLMRVRGVGEEYTDLLHEAGVDTVPELAQRNPANLYQKMVEINARRKLVRRLPSQSEVEDWVAQARRLPRVIEY